MGRDAVGGEDVWGRLETHFARLESVPMRALFDAHPHRGEAFSVDACGLYLDYAKHRLDDAALQDLCALARGAGIHECRRALFSGGEVNSTEHRPALHVALRHSAHTTVSSLDGPSPDVPSPDVPGPDVPSPDNELMGEIHEVARRVAELADAVREGRWRGYGGAPINSVVNIGIGGSELGPALAVSALAPHGYEGIRFHFVSNFDSAQLLGVLRECDPARTLFIVASKSFSTAETLLNANTARQWFLDGADPTATSAISKHFVAVSARPDRAVAFGIDAERVYPLWDWVGGRYSIWSAIALPVVIAVGAERFGEFLGGAHDMDRHFYTAALDANMPVILGLLGVWYRRFFGAASHAVLAYDYGLRRLPEYLQQLEMESNGKRVRMDGSPVGTPTAPVLWGGLGNNAQHAVMQMLHQGTDLVPVDFIVPVHSQSAAPGHESEVLANALAQARALMTGRSAQSLAEEAGDEALVAHRVMPGNRPSTTLMYDELTPRVLGALIALYEHKVFVQSVCWGNNPFDQWGVELGKEMAKSIRSALDAPESAPKGEFDSSTRALLRYVRAARRRRA